MHLSMLNLGIVLVASNTVGLLACSGSGASTANTTEAGASAGPPESSNTPDSSVSCVVDDTKMRCNDLVPGAAIYRTCREGDQPKSTGGAIVEGSYQLTAWTDYDSACPSRTQRAVARTITYRAGIFNEVVDADPLCTEDAGARLSSQRQRFTSSITTDGVDFKGQETCRSFNSDTLTSYSLYYTATATTLMIINHTDVDTYTLIP